MRVSILGFRFCILMNWAKVSKAVILQPPSFHYFNSKIFVTTPYIPIRMTKLDIPMGILYAGRVGKNSFVGILNYVHLCIGTKSNFQ